jgi:hypothetical protein
MSAKFRWYSEDHIPPKKLVLCIFDASVEHIEGWGENP